jgi:hypothetical protein
MPARAAELARAKMDRDHFYAAMLPTWEETFLKVFKTALPGQDCEAILDIQERFVQSQGGNGEDVRYNAHLALNWYLDRQEELTNDTTRAREVEPELTDDQHVWIKTFMEFTGVPLSVARERGACCHYGGVGRAGDVEVAIDEYLRGLDPPTPQLARSWSEEAVVGRADNNDLPELITPPDLNTRADPEHTQADPEQIARWTEGVNRAREAGAEAAGIGSDLLHEQTNSSGVPKSEHELTIEANQRKVEELRAEAEWVQTVAQLRDVRFRELGLFHRRRQQVGPGTQLNHVHDEQNEAEIADRDASDEGD